MIFTNDKAKFARPVGDLESFKGWHRIKKIDRFAYTTHCGLYTAIVKVVENYSEIPEGAELCPTIACNMKDVT